MAHTFRRVAHDLLICAIAFLAPCCGILGDLVICHHCFGDFTLAGLLLLHIYLLHLMLLHSLFFVHLLNLLISHVFLTI